MIKPYFITVFLLLCLVIKGQNRGTIHVKKNTIKTFKSCICGKTDTIFISKKKIFNDSTTVDICNGRIIIPNKVLGFTASFLNSNIRLTFDKNKFQFDKEIKQYFLNQINSLPPLTTMIISNVLFSTDYGQSELHPTGNLIVVLTD
jgi:hypothetical protein